MLRVIKNENTELVAAIEAKIKEHNGHCCCAFVFNDDNKCMCKDFRDKIKQGIPCECDCGLYRIVIEEDAK